MLYEYRLLGLGVKDMLIILLLCDFVQYKWLQIWTDVDPYNHVSDLYGNIQCNFNFVLRYTYVLNLENV